MGRTIILSISKIKRLRPTQIGSQEAGCMSTHETKILSCWVAKFLWKRKVRKSG